VSIGALAARQQNTAYIDSSTGFIGCVETSTFRTGSNPVGRSIRLFTYFYVEVKLKRSQACFRGDRLGRRHAPGYFPVVVVSFLTSLDLN
jgi:hypothetical protein